jgi:hypothetical protein
MTVLNIIQNFEEIYTNSINLNGIHGVDFYRNLKTREIIKIKDYLNLDNSDKKYYKKFNHLGVKQKIKDDVWIFCMFTSQAFIEMNTIKILNMELTDNIHKYVNKPIIVNNTTLCEYFIFHNNIEKYPKYCKEYIFSSKDVYANLIEIQEDSIKGYKLSLYAYDFNNPITLEEWIHECFKNKNNFLVKKELKYGTDPEYLRLIELTNTDIFIFINQILDNKNIYGENLINSEILMEKINEIKNYKINI